MQSQGEWACLFGFNQILLGQYIYTDLIFSLSLQCNVCISQRFHAHPRTINLQPAAHCATESYFMIPKYNYLESPSRHHDKFQSVVLSQDFFVA